MSNQQNKSGWPLRPPRPLSFTKDGLNHEEREALRGLRGLRDQLKRELLGRRRRRLAGEVAADVGRRATVNGPHTLGPWQETRKCLPVLRNQRHDDRRGPVCHVKHVVQLPGVVRDRLANDHDLRHPGVIGR